MNTDAEEEPSTSDEEITFDDTPPPENSPPAEARIAEPQEEELLGRGHRRKAPSVKLKSYVTNTAMSRVLKNNSGSSAYPIANYINGNHFSASHCAYMVAISEVYEPKTYAQAMTDKRWRDAMGVEIDAQELNRSWTIEDLPPGKKAIGCKWIYKIKYKSDGTLERYKARLVALGNRQIEGEDYGETFAPVAKMNTIRMFLRAAVGKGWDIHQMDVHNAFLHGDLDEEVYMKLPPGFHGTDSNKVCRLRKSLYGLKQAPRCWFWKLSTALKEYGFKQSRSDYSLFTYDKKGAHLQVLVYVDDLIVTGSTSEVMTTFRTYLSKCFHMKDLGVLKYFLGIEVARNSTGIYLSQRKYTLDIITETGLLGARPAAFLLEQNHKLALSTSPLLPNPEKYRRLVGRLIYLAVTRPELSFSVHTLAQFMQSPRDDHWEAAIRVVKYLKNNPGQGIFLKADNNFQIVGWCDSDWASCPLSRRSITGYFVQLGDSPVSWKTRKQPTVSPSSAEAEYRAMASLTQELIWLKRLLNDLGITHDQAMLMHCDSQAAIHISTNPVFHERTKHIGLDCHFVRDEIQSGNVLPRHVKTTMQLADIFTKPLGRDAFAAFRDKLGIRDLCAPT